LFFDELLLEDHFIVLQDLQDVSTRLQGGPHLCTGATGRLSRDHLTLHIRDADGGHITACGCRLKGQRKVTLTRIRSYLEGCRPDYRHWLTVGNRLVNKVPFTTPLEHFRSTISIKVYQPERSIGVPGCSRCGILQHRRILIGATAEAGTLPGTGVL